MNSQDLLAKDCWFNFSSPLFTPKNFFSHEISKKTCHVLVTQIFLFKLERLSLILARQLKMTEDESTLDDLPRKKILKVKFT